MCVCRVSRGGPCHVLRLRSRSREPSAFILQAFSAVALNPSLPVLCEKTPSNALYFQLLRRLVPGARMVGLVRDPIAVALSHTQRDWGPTDPVEAASYSAAYFRRWRMLEVQDQCCLVVRHEDLVAEADGSSREFSITCGCARMTLSCDTYAANYGRARIVGLCSLLPNLKQCGCG